MVRMALETQLSFGVQSILPFLLTEPVVFFQFRCQSLLIQFQELGSRLNFRSAPFFIWQILSDTSHALAIFTTLLIPKNLLFLRIVNIRHLEIEAFGALPPVIPEYLPFFRDFHFSLQLQPDGRVLFKATIIFFELEELFLEGVFASHFPSFLEVSDVLFD